ncbi:MAG: hypothetical protein NC191_07030, partial [Muribaculaceae bacterium]|nr:hypothetical protein [Muribaculaceae bacterium]
CKTLSEIKKKGKQAMQVGSGFHKVTENEGKEYISISIDEVLKLQYPILNEINITLWQVTDKRKDASPDWSLQIQKKQAKKEDNSEIPF